MKIIITNPGPVVVANMTALGERMKKAIDTAANMIASMIQDTARDRIAAAGRFGSRWTEGLHVNVESSGAMGKMLTVFHDIPYADIFETGGIIVGNPLLWIGISGTDAEGVPAREYGQLFSIKHPNGHPLLVGADRQPKYFGISSVNIPAKFGIGEAVDTILSDFQSVFDTAWQGAG